MNYAESATPRITNSSPAADEVIEAANEIIISLTNKSNFKGGLVTTYLERAKDQFNFYLGEHNSDDLLFRTIPAGKYILFVHVEG